MTERKDLRAALEIRPPSTHQSHLAIPTGSSKFAFGSLSILAIIVGPVASQDPCSNATIVTTFNSLSTDNLLYSVYCQRVLNDVANFMISTGNYPNTAININIQVLDDDGDVLCAAINALVMALEDSGIIIHSLPVSVSAVFDVNGVLLLDPTKLEIKDSTCRLLFCFDGDNIVVSEVLGSIPKERYITSQDVCLIASKRVHAFVRLAIESRLMKQLHIKNS